MVGRLLRERPHQKDVPHRSGPSGGKAASNNFERRHLSAGATKPGSDGRSHELSGLLFGRPGGAALPVERFEDYDRAILQVLATEEGLSDLPVITHMDFGHTDPMFVVPYKVRGRIDPIGKTFEIIENAVID